ASSFRSGLCPSPREPREPEARCASARASPSPCLPIPMSSCLCWVWGLLTGNGLDLEHIRDPCEHLQHPILQQRRHAFLLRTRRHLRNPRPLLNQVLDLRRRHQQLVQPHPPPIPPPAAPRTPPPPIPPPPPRPPQRVKRRRPIGLPQLLPLRRTRRGRDLARLAQRPRQPLRQHPQQRIGKVERVEPHVQQPRQRLRRTVGVQRAEHQMPRQRCFNPRVRRLRIAHLPHHNDVRIGP